MGQVPPAPSPAMANAHAGPQGSEQGAGLAGWSESRDSWRQQSWEGARTADGQPAVGPQATDGDSHRPGLPRRGGAERRGGSGGAERDGGRVHGQQPHPQGLLSRQSLFDFNR